MRSATRAAQKLPTNADELCREQFLRLSLTLRDGVIDRPQFYVNIDQTNVIYQTTNSRTFEERGSKQVAVVGQEEKRAFTLVVGISAAGDLLPFQVIYTGKTARSLPTLARRNEAEGLGIKFEFSGTDTYWSTFELMCKYISTILVPYWMHQKELADVPLDQECVLQLDVWSVHKSIAFRTWLNKNYHWIKYRYVPANMTGVAQPCDVGMQRPIKQVIRRCRNSDVIEETLASLRTGADPTTIRVDTTVGTLRDRSAGWILAAYQVLNRPEIVKKVRRKCPKCAFQPDMSHRHSHCAKLVLNSISPSKVLLAVKHSSCFGRSKLLNRNFGRRYRPGYNSRMDSMRRSQQTPSMMMKRMMSPFLLMMCLIMFRLKGFFKMDLR
jgi:hypothetical protein